MDKTVTIENVVASINFGVPIDLYAMATHNSFLSYNPTKFPALVLRLAKPKTTVLIFSSGKAVIVGAKSEYDIKRIVKRVALFLKDNGINLKSNAKASVKNIVASFSIGKAINLEKLGSTLEDSLYEPEQFPGLLYRASDAVFIIFASGKIICTGTKSEKQLMAAIESFLNVFQAYALSF